MRSSWARNARFAARDRLTDVMLERMLAGMSTRRYARTGEPTGSEIDRVTQSTSKSAVSREFVSRTREQFIDLMSRPLDDLRLAVVMLDGIELKGRCCMGALGIDTDGIKHPLRHGESMIETVRRIDRNVRYAMGDVLAYDAARRQMRHAVS